MIFFCFRENRKYHGNTALENNEGFPGKINVSMGLPQVSMARSAEALHRSVKGEGGSSPTAVKDGLPEI